MSQNWHALAKKSAQINKSKGFYVAGSGTPLEDVGIICLVATELEEALDWIARGGRLLDAEEDTVDEEIADAAIRVLSILNNLFGSSWEVAKEECPGAPWMEIMGPGSGFQYAGPGHEQLHFMCDSWIVLRHLFLAAESVRKSDHGRLLSHLEKALGAILALHLLYREDCKTTLEEQIECKLEYNRLRPHMHGKTA